MKERAEQIGEFRIYVDRLKHGHVEKIEERFTPDFLEIDEEDLRFEDPIVVKGEAYIAETDLILNLDVSTIAKMPCTICNEWVNVPIHIRKLYSTEPLSEIKSAIFSMKDVIREAILLETPAFAECANGQCTHRKEIQKYLKKPTSSEKDDEDGYHPFEGIKID